MIMSTTNETLTVLVFTKYYSYNMYVCVYYYLLNTCKNIRLYNLVEVVNPTWIVSSLSLSSLVE